MGGSGYQLFNASNPKNRVFGSQLISKTNLLASDSVTATVIPAINSLISCAHNRLIRVSTIDARFAASQFLAHFSSRISSSHNTRGGDAAFTVSFLTNSCGLSLKDAVSASKKLSIKSRERRDAVLELLIRYGFTNDQISSLIAKWPCILHSSAAKTLSPKLEFFRSIGVPPAVLSQKIAQYPALLKRSLRNYYIPWCSYLKSIVRSQNDIVVLFRNVRVFTKGWPNIVPANIQFLREKGIPESSIALLLVRGPLLMMVRKEKLSTCVDRAVEMGFDLSKVLSMSALQMFGRLSESTFKDKMDVYRRCGWSESDFNSAFLRHPTCVALSQRNIRSTMNFLVNEVGFKPADVARVPVILTYGLEKRMRPRWIVARILKAKGLMRESKAITHLFIISEADFLKKYISDHEGDIPQLLDIYRGKMSFVGIGLDGNFIARSCSQCPV